MQKKRDVRAFIGLIIFGAIPLILLIIVRNPINKTYKNDDKKLSGVIDNNFVDRLLSLDLSMTAQLTVNSGGGWPDSALKSANIIYKKKINITIDSWCSSACVEYLLPSAHSVTFRNQPMIGVHGNPIMAEYIEKKFEPVKSLKCPYITSNSMKYFYKVVGAREGFWKEQLKYLNLKKPVFEYGGGCARFQYVFSNHFWYPTSAQLRNGLGLEFTGTVCADDPKCYERKLSFHWKKGTKLAVGDTVFISKGKIWAFLHAFSH